MVRSSAFSRLPALDGLRGLAALAVVFSHVAALSYVPWGHAAPSHVQFALWHLGAPAVDLFFVLSGVVVGQSLRRRPAVWPYLKRRALRLLPVAYLGVLLGLLARFAARHAGPDFSVLITHDLHSPLTQTDLLGLCTLLWPVLDANHLNPPLWSLTVELQAALLMPLLVRLSRWSWTLPLVLLVSLLLAALLWFQAIYLPLFFLGVLLTRRSWQLPSWTLTPALLLGLAVLLQRYITGSNEVLTRWLTAPGALLLIASVMDGAATGVLCCQPVQQLGRLSYSLYATHFPLLLSVSVLLHPLGVPLLLSGLLGVPLSLLLAAGVHRWIERPLLVSLAPGTVPAQAGKAVG